MGLELTLDTVSAPVGFKLKKRWTLTSAVSSDNHCVQAQTMIMMFELGIPMDLIHSWSATSGCRGFIKKPKKIHFFYRLFTVKKIATTNFRRKRNACNIPRYQSERRLVIIDCPFEEFRQLGSYLDLPDKRSNKWAISPIDVAKCQSSV